MILSFSRFFEFFFIKFFALRVTPPAHNGPALAAKHVGELGSQNGAPNLQNRTQVGLRGTNMEAKLNQDGVRTAKTSDNKTHT